MIVAKRKGVLVFVLALSGFAARIGILACEGLRMQPPTAQPRAEPRQKASARPEKDVPKEKPPARTDLYGDLLPAGARARLGTLRLRHRQDVTAVAYSPDGSLLASSGWDEVIHFWDADTGKSIRELTDPRRDANLAIAFSPDGTKLASTGASGNVRLWDVKSGRKLFDVEGDKDRTWGLAFAPDGRSFATASHKGTVRLWDTATCTELRSFETGASSYDNSLPLAFSPDGQTLAAGIGGTIWLWDVKTGKQRLAIRKAHGNEVSSLAFLIEGTLISGGYRLVDAGKVDGQRSVRGVGELRFWDPTTGKKLRDLTTDGPDKRGCGLAVSRNGEVLAFSFRDEIRLWDLRSRKLLRKLTDYQNPYPQGAHDLMFSPNSKRLAAVMGDNVVRIWDTTSGRRLLSYPEAHRTGIDSVAYSPDGRLAATGGRDGVVRLWDVATAKEVGKLRFGDGAISGVEVVAFSADGRTVAAGGYEFSDLKYPGWLKLWDRESSAELWTQRLPSRVSALTFAPDGQSVATAIGDHPVVAQARGVNLNAIRLYERDTGKVRAQLKELPSRVIALVFSPDGKSLRSFADDQKLRDWELSAQKPLVPHLVNGERGFFQSAALSPDGKLLATSVFSADTIVLWDATTGKEVSKIRVPRSHGSMLAFSPDGRVLATGSIGFTNVRESCDYNIHLWDLLTEREIRKLLPGSPTAQALAFSPDGRELLAGMDNGTGLIWSVTDPAENGRKPKGHMAEEDLKRLWTDLGGEDTSRVYEAIGALVTAPQIALPFLKKRLQPVQPADPQRVRQLIANLDSSEFARREAANHELEELGDQVRPSLRKALEGKPPLEQRKRLEALLAAPRAIRRPKLLRQVRAVQVLEMIGSEEALELLWSAANGAAEARLTEEARESLQRLTIRPSVKP
jgi:WD40 repeat protein